MEIKQTFEEMEIDETKNISEPKKEKRIATIKRVFHRGRA